MKTGEFPVSRLKPFMRVEATGKYSGDKYNFIILEYDDKVYAHIVNENGCIGDATTSTWENYIFKKVFDKPEGRHEYLNFHQRGKILYDAIGEKQKEIQELGKTTEELQDKVDEILSKIQSLKNFLMQ